MLASKATQLRPKPPISALFARRPHINVGVAEQCYKISTPQATEEQLDAARKWLASLPEKPLPTDIGEVSYSRSSGPGGQNVNKYTLFLFRTLQPADTSKGQFESPAKGITRSPATACPYDFASRN